MLITNSLICMVFHCKNEKPLGYAINLEKVMKFKRNFYVFEFQSCVMLYFFPTKCF